MVKYSSRTPNWNNYSENVPSLLEAIRVDGTPDEIKANIDFWYDKLDNEFFNFVELPTHNGYSIIDYETIVFTMSGFDNLKHKYFKVDDKYYFVDDYQNVGNGNYQIVLKVDVWVSYFREIILNLNGTAKVTRKHFDRYTSKNDDDTLNFDFDYNSNVFNVDPKYANMTTNVVGTKMLDIDVNSLIVYELQITDTLLQDNAEIDRDVNRVYFWTDYIANNKKINGVYDINKQLYLYDIASTEDYRVLFNNLSTCTLPDTWKSGANGLLNPYVYVVKNQVQDNTPDEAYGILLSPEPLSDAEIVNRIGNVINKRVIYSKGQVDIVRLSGTVSMVGKYSNVRFKKFDPLFFQKWDFNQDLDLRFKFVSDDGQEIIINNMTCYNCYLYLYETTKYVINLITFSSILSGSTYEKPAFLTGSGDGLRHFIAFDMGIDYYDVYNSTYQKQKIPAKEFNNTSEFTLKISDCDYLDDYNNIDTYKPLYIPNSKYNVWNDPQLFLPHCLKMTLHYLDATKPLYYMLGSDNINFVFKQYITPNLAIDTIYLFDKNYGVGNKRFKFLLNNGALNKSYDNSIPSLSDTYKNYLATNQSQLTNSYLTAQGNLNYQKATYKNEMNALKLNNLGFGFLTNPIKKPLQDINAYNNKSLSYAQSQFNAKQGLKQIEASITDIYNAPDNIIGASNTIYETELQFKYFQYINNNTKSIAYIDIQAPPKTTIDEYSYELHKYGYISNNTLYVNLDLLFNRTNFNYVQIENIESCLLKNNPDVPLWVIEWFKNKFNEGVRMWDPKQINNIGDYQYENWERKITTQ